MAKVLMTLNDKKCSYPHFSNAGLVFGVRYQQAQVIADADTSDLAVSELLLQIGEANRQCINV